MTTNGNESTKRRVVITGMGTVSPMGKTLEDTWNNVSSGKTGIGYLDKEVLDVDLVSCKIGGHVPEFDPIEYMEKKDARRMDRYIQFGLAAGRLAYEDAGIKEGDFDPVRFGAVLGSGSGGIRTIESQLYQCIDRGYGKTSPFFIPMMLTDSGAGRLSIHFNAQGPNRALVTACATGTDSIGDAMKMIQNDEVDIMFAGGAESPMTPLAVSGFAAARALSMRNDDPERASRPFDKDRDGFVMSEGGAVLILEELEHAKKRGARIHAELVGYGSSSDAFDIVAPEPNGSGAKRAMQLALDSANLSPTDVQYINTHGTSTPLGDIAESKAIQHVYGDYATNGLVTSSTKSMHGHLLGATGALEAIICVQAIQNRTSPPTINLDNQDEECKLDYTANVAKKMDNLTTAMSNSFGFGGHNASIVIREFKD